MNAPVKIDAMVTTGPHVYCAIAAVMGALSKEGITKDRKASGGGANYSFRGVDDVYNALSSVLAENNLCIIPRVLSRDCVERQSKAGGALFYTTVDVEFDLISALDGSRHTARTQGEAMDSSDKSTNKAMSAAYKYMAFQTFCIPTEADNDSETAHHDVLPRKAGWVVAAKAGVECLNTEGECGAWYKANLEMMKAQPSAERDEVLAYLKARKTSLAPLPITHGPTDDEARFSRPSANSVARSDGGPDPFGPDDEIPF